MIQWTTYLNARHATIGTSTACGDTVDAAAADAPAMPCEMCLASVMSAAKTAFEGLPLVGKLQP